MSNKDLLHNSATQGTMPYALQLMQQ